MHLQRKRKKDKEDYLMSKEELLCVYGGSRATISGSLINSIARIGELFYQVGTVLGSSIRRIKSKRYC